MSAEVVVPGAQGMNHLPTFERRNWTGQQKEAVGRNMTNKKPTQMTPGALVALRGLRLPRVTLECLWKSGIRCIPELSIEHQKSSQQYVIRSQESGGAIAELGVYCGYVSETGGPLAWLQRLDSLGVNGVHARAVSVSLVRIQVVRVQNTYDVLISRHALQFEEARKRPTLQNTIIFLGRQGTLEMDLCDKDKGLCGAVLPVFYDRSGEPMKIPLSFETAVRRAVAGANCCGCRHVHLLEPPPIPEHPLQEYSQQAESPVPAVGMN